MDSVLDDMFVDEVLIKRTTGTNAYGKRTYANPISERAMVQGQNMIIYTSLTESVTSNARVIFARAVFISKGDKVILPAPHAVDGKELLVLKVSQFMDPLTGAYTTEIYV